MSLAQGVGPRMVMGSIILDQRHEFEFLFLAGFLRGIQAMKQHSEKISKLVLQVMEAGG